MYVSTKSVPEADSHFRGRRLAEWLGVVLHSTCCDARLHNTIKLRVIISAVWL